MLFRSLNPEASNYTERYYEMYNETAGNYENTDQILNGGGLTNGWRPGDLAGYVNNTWYNPGRVYNGNSIRNNSQFRIIASGSADVKNHAISAGFEYEQRNDRYFGVAPVALWRQMSQLTNAHITQLDLANPHPVYTDYYGTATTEDDTVFPTNGYINYDRLYDGVSQTLFDYNLRNELGLDPSGLDWIDLNALPPSTFSLDMFSPDELLNGGNNYVSYYGYDYTGKKIKGRPTLDDFFTKTRTVDGYDGPTVFEQIGRAHV